MIWCIYTHGWQVYLTNVDWCPCRVEASPKWQQTILSWHKFILWTPHNGPEQSQNQTNAWSYALVWFCLSSGPLWYCSQGVCACVGEGFTSLPVAHISCESCWLFAPAQILLLHGLGVIIPPTLDHSSPVCNTDIITGWLILGNGAYWLIVIIIQLKLSLIARSRGANMGPIWGR